MNRLKRIKQSTICLSMFLLFAVMIYAQPAKIPFHREPYFVHSGIHDGHVGSEAETYEAFREVIWVPGAPWLRLQFQSSNLGKHESIVINPNDSNIIEDDSIRSFIIITSLEDGAQQYLDAVSLNQWRNTSAFFNGDAVEIELHVAPKDRGIFFEIREILVGEGFDLLGKTFQPSSLNSILTLCDGDDDRVSTNDPAVGRVLMLTTQTDTVAFCTGWITANGAHLSAGHCEAIDQWGFDWDIDILEFNVQPSDNSGNPVFSHPDHQYSVNRNSINYTPNPFRGNDWAVFDVYPNSNTEKLPVHAYGGFYRMTRDLEPPINQLVRVTGYGIDETPPGPGGGPWYCPNCNEDSQTLQTDTGEYRGEDSTSATNIYHNYRADTESANSGSPVINIANTLSIGIHTNGGCTPGGGANSATSFEHDNLRNAIQNFPGTNVEYVDKDHPAPDSGTVFRPYSEVQDAVEEVPAGGIVSIVKGYYNETMTINTAMTLTAPVGMVTIGASGFGKLSAGSPATAAPAVQDSASSLIPNVYSLSHNYPNPFNPNTTLRFGLPEPARTRLMVYDLLGREVVRLVDEHLEPGYHAVVWHGKTATGIDVPSGIYIARLITPQYTKSIKMLMLK